MLSEILTAQNISELQKERERTREQIELTKKIISTTSQKKRENLNQLNIVNKGIELQERLINSLELEIALLEEEIEKMRSNIEIMNEEIVKETKEYERIVIQAFKEEKGYHPLIFIFSSASFNQAYKRVKYLQQLAKYRKTKVKKIQELRKKLLMEISGLEEQKKNKSMLLKERERENNVLVAQKYNKQELVKKLGGEERKLRQQLSEKTKIAERLEKTIKEIIEAETKKNAERNIKLTPEQAIIDRNFKTNKGRLPWPTERGIITGKFGEQPHPVLKGVKLSSNGVDITTVPGTEARAIFEGEVSMVANIPGANHVVIIRHGNFLTMYSNLVEVYVKNGQKVKIKEPIGKIFTDTGENEKTIIHLEIWEENNKLNPTEWLSKES